MTCLPSPLSPRAPEQSSPQEFHCPSPFARSPSLRKCRHSHLCPWALRSFESPIRRLVDRTCGPHNSITVDVAIFLSRSFFVLTRRFRGGGRGRLQDEHAIAVTVEAISDTDRFLVRTKNEFASSKRTHQHQQGRAREVKIGQQRIDKSKRKRRINEQIGLA